jgi:hypothetical protein
MKKEEMMMMKTLKRLKKKRIFLNYSFMITQRTRAITHGPVTIAQSRRMLRILLPIRN